MEMKKNIFRVFVLAGLLCCGCRDGFTVRQALERAGENRPQLEAVLEHFKDDCLTGFLCIGLYEFGIMLIFVRKHRGGRFCCFIHCAALLFYDLPIQVPDQHLQ